MDKGLRSSLLKVSLFATGLSGIVAEYILSTLATYLLGDSVLQWTLIVSVMLFSMGLGSRLSQYIQTNLIQTFIIAEFTLSILVAYSSMMAYSAAAFTIYTGAIIYTLSILIGILIGLEIPLVVRLNDQFESLRINVAVIIEKDYYGSLAGGLFFAFVGLPYFGLTYTPFILGLINFIVALLLLQSVINHLSISHKKLFITFSIVTAVVIIGGIFIAKPVILYGEQKRYKDKVIFETQSRYQRIVITQWKNDYWLYLDGHLQLCSADEIMYHEPLVHPALSLHGYPQKVLILGGGDGCATREVLKYPSVEQITLVDIDPKMTDLALHNPILTNLNQNSLHNPKVTIINTDAFKYMDTTRTYFDIIIIDLPDPKSIELGRLYSYEFYKLCKRHLRPKGILITQAGSPYFASNAFNCINRTMQSAGYSTIPMHNQVLTMGEWGWVMGLSDSSDVNIAKQKLQQLQFDSIETKWLNNEAMKVITSFGKILYPSHNRLDSIETNTLNNPVLHKYYNKGNWDLY